MKKALIRLRFMLKMNLFVQLLEEPDLPNVEETMQEALQRKSRLKNWAIHKVLWLDGVHRKYVEEVGSMNVMFKIEGKIVTAPCEGTVLPGVTRDSIITLLKSWGYEIVERHLSIDELMEAGHSGKLEEAWGTGTAAVISPIGELYYKGDVVTVHDFMTGELTQKTI
mgnify:CR=1 FL=1